MEQKRATPIPRDRGGESHFAIAHRSGPLPDPQEMADYSKAGEDFPERIMKMAESEQAHRHEQEGRMVQSRITAETRGQWMGFAVSFTALAGVLWLIFSGSYWPAVWLFGLATLFVSLATDMLSRFIGLFQREKSEAQNK